MFRKVWKILCGILCIKLDLRKPKYEWFVNKLIKLASESPLSLTAFALCFGYGAYTAIFETMPLDFRVVIAIAAAVVIIEEDQSKKNKHSFFEYTVIFFVFAFWMTMFFCVGFLLGFSH